MKIYRTLIHIFFHSENLTPLPTPSRARRHVRGLRSAPSLTSEDRKTERGHRSDENVISCFLLQRCVRTLHFFPLFLEVV